MKIDSLPNTSTVTIRRLKSLGIQTYLDLLNYFPFRYEDYSIISPITKVQEGEQITIQGKIVQSQNIYTRTGLRIQRILVQDTTGILELNWYNQPYLTKLLHSDLYISVSGQIKWVGKKISMFPKEYEIVHDPLHIQTKHTGRIVPIYSEKNGLSSKTIREKIFYLLNNFCADRLQSSIKEILPAEVISYNTLIDELSAYQNIHFPNNLIVLKKAQERLSFDELFSIQLANTLVRKEWDKEVVGKQFHVGTIHELSLQTFIDNLPFKLTGAQIRVIREIRDDLGKTKPMNRFLQGEVGSGKTVVATIACYIAFLNGFQSLFMAPTEILAQQHYKTITDLFNHKSQMTNDKSITNLQISNKKKPKIILITGSVKPLVKEIQNADIIIGTHALIQKKIMYKKVGLVIVDEQHRFGVSQRAMLKEKGISPHLLTMTATPIPRTVMLTLFGELDMSVIDEMPRDRLPIKTFFIPKNKREDCYRWVKKQIIQSDIQVFVICPLIEESEVETMQSVKAAKKEAEFLQASIFPEFAIGLIHGKMKSEEKEETMNNFKNKKYHILVATSVVEVGIDIPNAAIMLIEGSERFGLAQLHQLRGRVGRGNKQSYCFLFTEKESPEITKRLQLVAKTQNGNVLAEKDLELRGAGTIYGTKQHGIVELKIASLSDYTLIEKTRKAVENFIGKYKLEDFGELERRVKEYKVEQVTRD